MWIILGVQPVRKLPVARVAEVLRKWRRFMRGVLLGLVAGDGGVDGSGVVIDAAGEGLGVVEALDTQPHGDGKGAGAVVAEDDDGLVGIELGVSAGCDLAHGDEGGSGDGGGLGLPGLTNV